MIMSPAEYVATNVKPGLGRGFDARDCHRESVGSAELVVQAHQVEIDVLVDLVAKARDENYVLIAHEQVIVLEAERQIRGDAIFEANADRGTPSRLICSIVHHTRTEESRVFVVGDRCAALDVEQGIVPGVADLTGEKAETTYPGLILITGLEANIAAGEISPVDQCFHAEDPGRQLPAVAELSTKRAARRVMAAFVPDTIEIPVKAAGTTAAVDADIEAAPIIDRDNRLGIIGWSCRKIRGNGWCSAKRNSSRRDKQEFPHRLVFRPKIVPHDGQFYHHKTEMLSPGSNIHLERVLA